jgi:hypothetical protein
MSFGLQALFFWAVFLQRKSLSESLIGIATGPGAPGREGTLRVMALYAGARTMGRPLRGLRRASRRAGEAPGRALSGLGGRFGGGGGPGSRAPLFGTTYSAPVGGGAPSMDAPGPTERPPSASTEGETGRKKPSARPSSRHGAEDGGRAAVIGGAASERAAKRKRKRSPREPSTAESAQRKSGTGKPGKEPAQRPPAAQPNREEPTRPAPSTESARGQSLTDELRSERERARKKAPECVAEQQAQEVEGAPASPPRRRRRWRRGRAG